MDSKANNPKAFRGLTREAPYLILVLPALIIFAAFTAYPAFSSIYHSFTNWSKLLQTDYKFVGLRQYERLFQDSSVFVGIRNSFLYAILATLLQSVVGLALALVLNMKFRTKNILRAVWYFPAVLSTLVIGFLFNFVLTSSDLGLINSVLLKFGFSKVNLLGNGTTALACIIFVAVWQWAGWTMTIYLANLQGIPDELYEAAVIDGAGTFTRFVNITVPMLFPAVSYTFVTGMIAGLKVFDIIYALTHGGPAGSTESIVSLIIKKGFTDGFYAYSCAMGVVFLVIVMIITVFQMRFFNSWGDNIT